jgi:hypothetical protein
MMLDVIKLFKVRFCTSSLLRSVQRRFVLLIHLMMLDVIKLFKVRFCTSSLL